MKHYAINFYSSRECAGESTQKAICGSSDSNLTCDQSIINCSNCLKELAVMSAFWKETQKFSVTHGGKLIKHILARQP